MDDAPIEAAYELTMGDASRAQARLLLASRWLQALLLLGSLGAAHWLLARLTGPLLGEGALGAAVASGLDVFAVTLLVLLAVGPLLVLRHAARMRDAARGRGPFTLTLDAEGYESDETGRVAWRALAGADEAWGVFLFHVSPRRVLVVPHRILRGRDARLRAWLREARSR